MTRDRIRCYKCREYDHFAKDCPISRGKRELEHLQQMHNLEDEQTSLKLLTTNTQDNFNRINSEENFKTGRFKLMKGRNDPITFSPLSPKIYGQIDNNKPKDDQYLTEEQTRHVYKKIELSGIIDADALHHEIEQERELNRIDDASRERNPYKELIVNNAGKIESLMTQMEQWSIISNKLNYI